MFSIIKQTNKIRSAIKYFLYAVILLSTESNSLNVREKLCGADGKGWYNICRFIIST